MAFRRAAILWTAFGVTVALCWFWFLSALRTHPTLFFDETYYLYGAWLQRHFGSFHPDGRAPFELYPYAPLYSMLGAVVSATDKVREAYPAMLRMNGILLAAGVAVWAWSVVRDVAKTRGALVLAVVLCVASSAVSGYAMVAMSEALFIPLFLLLCAVLYQTRGESRAAIVVVPILAAALTLTRKSGIAIAIALPVAFLVQTRLRLRMRHALVLTLAAVATAAAWYWTTEVLRLTAAGQTVGAYSQSLFTPRVFAAALRPLAGQVAYLQLASGFLFVYAVWWVVSLWRTGERRPAMLMTLGAILALPGMGHMVMVRLTGSTASRYLMYGRYIDHLVPVVCTFGVAGVIRATNATGLRSMTHVCLAALAAIVAFCVPSSIEGVRVLNMGAGWAAMLLHHSPIGGRTALLVLGITVGVLPMLRLGRLRLGYLLLALALAVQPLSLWLIAREHAECEKGDSKLYRALEGPSISGATVSIVGALQRPEHRFAARYYLGDKLVGSGNSAEYLLTGDAKVTRREVIQPRGLLEKYDESWVDGGVRSVVDNPWGKTVVPLDLTGYGQALASLSGRSSVTFRDLSTEMWKEGALRLKVGFHPDAVGWRISDGADVSAWLLDSSGERILWQARIQPDDGFKAALIRLADIQGPAFSIALRTGDNPPQHLLGDWVVWLAPTLSTGSAEEQP